MEDAFWNWMADSYEEGTLTFTEVERCCEDPCQAYRLFIDFIESDRIASGDMAQEEIRRFKKHLYIKMKREYAKTEMGSASLH